METLRVGNMDRLLTTLHVLLCLILLALWNTLTPFGVLILTLLMFHLFGWLLQQFGSSDKYTGKRQFRNQHEPAENSLTENKHHQLTSTNFRSTFPSGNVRAINIRNDRAVDNVYVAGTLIGLKTGLDKTSKANVRVRKGRNKAKQTKQKSRKYRRPVDVDTKEEVFGLQPVDDESDNLTIKIKTKIPQLGCKESAEHVFTKHTDRCIVVQCEQDKKRAVKEAEERDTDTPTNVRVKLKENRTYKQGFEAPLTASELAMRKISKLLQEGQDALEKGNREMARKKALQAVVGIDDEKDKLLSGQRSDVSEQQIGDWYGGCSFILNSVGDTMSATKCFYTATVFDHSWDVRNHKATAEVLWGSLVFSKVIDQLAFEYKKVRKLLADVDEIARLAERLGKWNVCMAADGDINRIYSYLMQKNLTADELINQPGRKASMWRTARCFLRLGMHDDARKLCSTILQHACDYDDPEAFEIWAFSLYSTKDFDIALEKCELALKYCKDEEYRRRLEAFRSEIQNQIGNSDLTQQNENAKTLEDQKKQLFNQRNRNDNRHGQLEGNKRAVQKTFSSASRARKVTDNVASTSSCSTPHRQINRASKTKQKTKDTLQTVARKLESANGQIIYERKRTLSRCSTSTVESDRSEISSGMMFESSEPGSSDENFDIDLSAGEETLNGNWLSQIDQEEEALQEEMSFYEQSMRYHLQNDGTEDLEKVDSDEKLLRYGLRLSSSYMHHFEDKHPDVLKRDQFYPDFLDKSKLTEKLLQNPKKYIRCVIEIEGSHEAFCTPVDTNESLQVIEISGRSKIGQVFNEDEVVVEILDDKDIKGKRFGKVIGIWNRQRHKDVKHPVFICTIDDMESNLVRPMCKTIPKLHIIDREIAQKYKSINAKKYKIETYDYDRAAEVLCNPKIIHLNPAEQRSYIFLVAFISWSPRHIYPRGAVIKMLPPGLTESSGLMILNLQHEVPALYTKPTVDQVASMSKRLGDEPTHTMLQGRRDLTRLTTFTIDPYDSKDLDDALSIEAVDDGYKVGVHIADVATYVPQNSPLDEESRQRATTFYPGIRRPRNMLPEPFSTNICSLLPNKTRLTISLFFYLTNEGRPRQMERSNFEILKSYIRSAKQLTYDEAQNIILLEKSEDMDQVKKSVKTLYKLAKKIRKLRLGNAMFAMDFDWEELGQGESESQTVEAHYLVEEFMIMANKKVADWLLRHRFNGYSQCVPLRCQPPPTKENIEEFLQKNSCYIDILLRLQDKQIGPKRPSFYEYLNSENTHKGRSIILSKDVWEEMRQSPTTAAELLKKDDLHPLQLTVYQHWLSIQEKAGYRCSGSIKGEEGGRHSSLDIYPYTHFTSPIRRYNDLIVQRLVHAAFRNSPCPYEKKDIESICVHINAVAKRAKEYDKGCRSLQKAIEYRTNPKMLKCYVDDVSDRGVLLCSPLLKFVPKPQRELTFNLLDMGHKPEVVEDPDTKWNRVIAVWRKRLYDFVEKPNYPPARGNEYQLNPHKGVVFLQLHEWARMLRATTDGHEEDLARAIRNASVSIHRKGYDDVTTECRNSLKIQPNTKFSMTFSRGQQVKIQMSAAPNKGVITPKPVLYSMTYNVKFCLQHTENPVLHLYHYVTRSTCDKYPDIRNYLERWLPIVLMEAATGIVRNEESCCINNVNIKFLDDRKGKFALGLAECEIRNIDLSGTISEDGDDVRSDESCASYDWLCLKAEIPNPSKLTARDKTKDFQNLNAVWIGHAEVIKVVKKRNQYSPDGNINVTFQLHDRTPALPSNFPSDTRFSVEILKKSEVDRRTESFMKELRSQSDSLAAKIALNKRIPDFDRSRSHIASLRHNQDLVFVKHHDDPTQRKTVLPRNNAKQQEAINKALTSRFSLIQGPPGTGKTYTGIKLMYLFDRINFQLSKEGHPRKQVLFCGPSNKSVDLVAKWMLQRMEHYKPNFIRVYGRSIEAIDFPIPGRTFLSKRSTRGSHTDPALKSVSLHHLIRQKGEKYAEEINAKDKFFRENNYEPMPEIVKEYVHIVREASIEVIRKYDVILCTTAVGANPKVLEATNVYQVIVDEAGMCPEPQCLVPVIATKAEQVVLIGDHKQLRPIIMCKEAAQLGLETSLFERYATTKSSRNVQFTRLEEQYRMNPEICRFPSKLFYDSALKTMPGIWRDETLTIWPTDAKGTYPHVLVHIEGEERVLTVSTEDGNEQSRSNEAEIDHVITTYQYLKREVPNESVQILSQYNAQCSEIKRKLKQNGIDEYEEVVSTVVSSQGGEWNYVIFSTVRSLPEYKIEKNPTLGWCKHNLGFITDRNQVNVALTRARKGLIIIGNKDLLACDYVWKRLIQHYDQRGCLKKPEEFPPQFIRKSRQQIMEEAYTRTYRRFGDSIFEKGEATSYEGSFDNVYDEDEIWKPRVASRRT